MSAEIRALLASAAPSPTGSLDVAAIVSRGHRVRIRRMVAIATAIPVIVGALWAGANAALEDGPATPPTASASPSPCRWEGGVLNLFITRSASDGEIGNLTRRLRALPHVEAVEYFDFNLPKDAWRFTGGVPGAWDKVWAQLFSRWVELRVDDPANAAAVVDGLPEFPAIGQISDGTLEPAPCRGKVEAERESLEDHLRKSLEDHLRKLQKRHDGKRARRLRELVRTVNKRLARATSGRR